MHLSRAVCRAARAAAPRAPRIAWREPERMVRSAVEPRQIGRHSWSAGGKSARTVYTRKLEVVLSPFDQLATYGAWTPLSSPTLSLRCCLEDSMIMCAVAAIHPTAKSSRLIP
eukprot:6208856-Pleurochrysis_carterae.AAC.3